MNELIKINHETSDRPTVMGRELHEALGIKTQYSKWFERMCEYGFTENSDFVTIVKNVYREDGTVMPKNQTDHAITIDMAKELCMIQRTEQGKKCRQYFLEVEKMWNSPEVIMKRALNLADEKIKLLELERMNAPITAEQHSQLCEETAIKAIDLCNSGRVYVKLGYKIRSEMRIKICAELGAEDLEAIPTGRFDEAVELCRTFKPDADLKKRIAECRAELKKGEKKCPKAHQ